MSIMFYLGLAFVSIVDSGYIYLQYKHTGSNLFTYYAIFYGILSHTIQK